MAFQFLGTRLRIEPADSPWPAVDALILPANNYLWMAGGPALSVKQSAGDSVEQEAVRSGPIGIGEAVAAGAGALSLKGIIHAAVMEQDLRVDVDAALRALDSALRIAREKGWSRLLVHSFVAAGRATPKEIAHRLLAHLVERLLEGSELDEVVLLAVDEPERELLHTSLLRVIQGHP